MSAYEYNASISGYGTFEDTNPIVSKVGDFTPFYAAIAFSSALLGFLIILNIVCCCSKFADYWLDRHTGNRWIISIWSETPHKQPPLDLSELKVIAPVQYNATSHLEYLDELHHESEVPHSLSQQPLTASQEYLELHKRESDI